MVSPTIKIKPEVMEKLEDLKVHPRQSFNDVIDKLVVFFCDRGGKARILYEMLKTDPQLKDKVVGLPGTDYRDKFDEIFKMDKKEEESMKLIKDKIVEENLNKGMMWKDGYWYGNAKTSKIPKKKRLEDYKKAMKKKEVKK